MINIVIDTDRITRRWSVKIVKLGAALSAGWLALTAVGLTASVPAWAPQIAAGLIFAGAVIAAYLPQSDLPDLPRDAP